MISCEKYDYIEIACMHRYPIKLTMKAGSVLAGIALDTVRNESRQECLVISDDGGEVLVVLDDIAMLEVGIDNPHFESVSFS
ncbi:Rho-binding antiterminator [Vibrio tapetis subsp. quintayensis]|uniref:Rho-binding antiterminator n=1 Tax=Vibrio tapetis TaxID=52443 RepID=UPI0025B53B07|nr:Rho-binding antiterminator [Vibrio tapetis]MDN3682249.1 Rho-binding antiterminator [Vibrio tapetis subsp. quintayensis]